MAERLSKRYREAREKAPETPVPLAEAVEILKGFPATKFDATVELVMHLGIDPRQADQQMRGSISLPHGIGRTRRVIAFCEGDDAEAAKEAGAVEAGGEELVQKVQGGWTDFDVAITTPQMMKMVAPLGRVLGPQGLMPSPKAGTLVQDIPTAVAEFSAGKVEYRNDDGGNLHVPVGKLSFDSEKLVENIDYFIKFVRKSRPTTTKGMYMRRVCICSTMSPSVEIDVVRRVGVTNE
ncbi:MAG: 50S ribosomal protein L1 [Phycisphaerae bacterium]